MLLPLVAVGSVWFSEVIISLNGINQLVFITEKHCVFFAVGIDLLNIISFCTELKAPKVVENQTLWPALQVYKCMKASVAPETASVVKAIEVLQRTPRVYLPRVRSAVIQVARCHKAETEVTVLVEYNATFRFAWGSYSNRFVCISMFIVRRRFECRLCSAVVRRLLPLYGLFSGTLIVLGRSGVQISAPETRYPDWNFQFLLLIKHLWVYAVLSEVLAALLNKPRINKCW